MKSSQRIAVMSLSIFLFGAVLAAPVKAENSLKTGSFGLTGEVADSDLTLTGRYFLQDALAALLRFGFQFESTDVGPDDNSGTSWRLGLGVRHYYSQEDFAPMAGIDLDYVADYDPIVDDDDNGFDLAVYGGAEYFIHRRVSVEGKVGLLVTDRSNGADRTTFGSFTSSVGVTGYFP